jgi:hypothetical protein
VLLPFWILFRAAYQSIWFADVNGGRGAWRTAGAVGNDNWTDQNVVRSGYQLVM